jgi:hypothetical protein
MSTKNILSQFLFILSITFIPFNASAVNCNDKSKSFIKEGEKYYNMKEEKSLTRKQKRSVKEVFSTLKSRLKGHSSIMYCKGPVKNTKKVFEKENITAEFDISTDSGPLFDLDIHNVQKNSDYREKINYFGRDKFKVNKISGNNLNVTYKYNKRIKASNGAMRSVLTEKIIDVTVDEGKVKIIVLIYLFGYFASERTIYLH